MIFLYSAKKHVEVTVGACLAAGLLFFIFSSSTVYAEGSVLVEPDDTHWSKEWHLRQIGAPEAWAVTTGSRRVIVAIIDGGVDITHPDLRHAIWTNAHEVADDGIDNDRNGLVDDIHGWNYVLGQGDVRPVYKAVQYEETWSHGTIVATLLAAKGNDGAGMAGVAWNVTLMPLVVLDANGSGSVSHVTDAIRYAVSHGAQVINMSFVGYDRDPALEETIKNAVDAGVVLVIATGNGELKEGYDIDQTPAYPVCFDGDRNQVLGVSATDALDQRAPYANYGRDCTDLSAPGHELFAGRPSYAHNQGVTNVPAFLGGLSGTSLAAPLVSGVAALIRSIRPDLTGLQVRERIRETADPIDAHLLPAYKGTLGRGRLNAARALFGITSWIGASVVTPMIGSTHDADGPDPLESPDAQALPDLFKWMWDKMTP